MSKIPDENLKVKRITRILKFEAYEMGRLSETVATVELRRFEVTTLRFDKRIESVSPRKEVTWESCLKAKEWSVGLLKDKEVGEEIGSTADSMLAAIDFQQRTKPSSLPASTYCTIITGFTCCATFFMFKWVGLNGYPINPNKMGCNSRVKGLVRRIAWSLPRVG